MKQLSVLVLLILSALGFSQAAAPTLSVSAPPKQVAAGGKVTLTLTLTFAPGMHGYQNPPAQEYEMLAALMDKMGPQ